MSDEEENADDLAAQIASQLGEDDDEEEGAEEEEGGGGADAASALLSALSDDDEEGEEESGGGDEGDSGPVNTGSPEDRDRNLDLILDIPLRVTVELGKTKMIVSDLLNLGQGSVVELSKLAGESMEVLVNDKLVAKGEAVVVNEKFGVRLTDIISKAERVEKLA